MLTNTKLFTKGVEDESNLHKRIWPSIEYALGQSSYKQKAPIPNYFEPLFLDREALDLDGIASATWEVGILGRWWPTDRNA